MITLRPAAERGHARHGWLESWHSFSFADYRDPRHVHWGPLRVINDDVIAPGQGFGAHPHRDMEILTWVLSGRLAHRDSMGHGAEIVPGEMQQMSAGTGVTHSEFNPDPAAPVHLLQIWIIPSVTGVPPRYAQTRFDEAGRRGRLCLVASPDGAGGSIPIHQDTRMFAGLFDGDEAAALDIAAGRLAYVHVARGRVVVNGHALSAGDALLYADEPRVEIAGGEDAELLVFDLPRLD
jgi:redox-sensitive bicupin YhaK (pirin superfamily)